MNCEGSPFCSEKVVYVKRMSGKKILCPRGFGFITEPTISEINDVLTEDFSNDEVPATYLLEFLLDSLDDDRETELKVQ
ncbi:hypothetical protein TNCV_1998091 [Trichonephila clavipes]|uniref:Uncharacterized protein n=1 Tax=Trichonephila clavipes TaxID=2585209 RepID=A0A8X6RY48_TRICX|nr:hypothetical protein TNCV_1998091 [Trichonephila clavipes]